MSTHKELVASIDIGTNSVLLLVAEKANRKLIPLAELQEVPRLGKGVDQQKMLHPESCTRVIGVLKSYRTYLGEHYPSVIDKVIVTATSAVRDASNRTDFIRDIQQATGWHVQLLSGKEESVTTFYGAVSVLDKIGSNQVVLDIGGGSTEIALGEGGRLKESVSLDMGSVRFSERFLTSNPPTVDQIQTARNAAQKLLNSSTQVSADAEVVAVAGTVTSLAAIELKLKSYDANQINGYVLNRTSIQKFIDEFSEMESDEIEKMYALFLTGRGDVILGGLLILDEFLKWCGKDKLTVSTGGIRHGILLTD